ncbi:MAG: glycogen debranching protein GlgX [Planctomycetes bacterium]|nr:glycogen debranching protein GlgX [Planctomycetota bacterium]
METLERGRALGALREGASTCFRVAADGATSVELCLFDDAAAEREARRVPMARAADGAWEARVACGAGQLYGYRADGPWDPARGQLYNPHKLLADPCARAFQRTGRFDAALYARTAEAPGVRDERDSAPFAPRAVVVDTEFDWRGDVRPRTPWARTVIYEAHVKGLTQRHPDVPEQDRGRYLGLTAPAVLAHLSELGVTAVELLPVHQHALDEHLARVGLVNYWGYSTLGFCAPDARFASGATGEQVREFQEMVRRLHAAGFEVILDVVYNHTCEGTPEGPTYGLRGLDNLGYYRTVPGRPDCYEDVTGTGNTLDTRGGQGLELVMESLRFWVREMHVDGFRFDLAPALARDPHLPNPDARFFQALRADPLFDDVKLIAEAWDVGHEGYQVGGFPAEWADWNGRYRDLVRGFWGRGGARVADLARSLSGTRSLFQHKRQRAHGGVHYVTCHDDFTLADLVSYERKHNEANGEQNRDGHDDPRSCNWGVEGPTDDPAVLRLRERARRNLFATVALSMGVPMLSHGDELGRTQGGNNNAYCHDDERVWVDWSALDDPRQAAFLEFARAALALRAGNAIFRRAAFLTGRVDAEGRKDVVWLHAEGRELTLSDWEAGHEHALGVLLPAAALETDEPEATVLLLANGSDADVRFRLPRRRGGQRWRCALHTAEEPPADLDGKYVDLAPHALVVLELEGRDG